MDPRAIAMEKILKKKICRKCGARNPWNAKRCRKCGSNSLRPKKSGKRWWISRSVVMITFLLLLNSLINCEKKI